MKKIQLAAALIVTAAIASTATVAAVRYLPWTVNIYSVSSNEVNNCDGAECYPRTVSTFDDRGNKCYVVTGRRNSDTPPSISCVRMR